MRTQRQRTVATIRGIDIPTIKEMIDGMYGTCYWSTDDDGARKCFPTLDSSVTIVIERDDKGHATDD